MAIRDKALTSEAFCSLKTIYENREEYLYRWKKSGKGVVGTLGCDVPDEILIAAGYLPVRIYAGKDQELNEADKYLEYSFDPNVRAQFQRIVEGKYYNLFDKIVISNSTDAMIRIYFYLREILHIEPEKKVPPIYFIDWLFTRTALHQLRNEKTIQLFVNEVTKWHGAQIKDEAIKNAIKVCNENRSVLQEFDKLRLSENATVNGSEALVVIGSSLFMDKEEHSQLVRQVIKDARTWDAVAGPRIYLTGSVQEDRTLYELIEDAGGTVLSEDHDWGARHYDRNISLEMDSIKGIVDRYMLRSFSSKKSLVSQRVEGLKQEVLRTKADAVLFYFRNFEDSPSWDYPEQKKMLDELSILQLYLDKQPLLIDDEGTLRDIISEFFDRIGGVTHENQKQTFRGSYALS